MTEDRPMARFENFEQYRRTYERLVELERREEMERHRREIRDMTARERQSEGRALLDLKGRDQGTGLGGSHLVKFVRGGELPETEISVGDLVMVSMNEPLNEDNPTGTVLEKTNYSITAAFRNRPQGFVYGKGLRLDLYVNDVTFQRMLDAIEDFSSPEGRQQRLRDLLLGRVEPEFGPEEEVEFLNPALDSSQKQAVREALKARDVLLIHGPPGTGKTTTLVEAVEQFADRGDKVLATAASNVAVDNMVDFLTRRGRRAVRVGHPARVTERLRQHTLDFLVQDREQFREARELRERVDELDDKQEQYTFPSGKNRRGLGNEQIKDLARRGKGSRGLSPDKIKSIARWIELQDEIGDLIDRAEALEDEAVSEILDEADVVCTTNSTAGSELLQDRHFDVAAIDEATQATEPSCLIPMTRADRVVMAGDHRQLPPTVLNMEAAEGGLSHTLFERFLELHGGGIKEMLRVQYRMNTTIMQFPGDTFYDGELEAAGEVADHTLDISLDGADTSAGRACSPEPVITFVDTCGRHPERSRKGSPSKENQGEALFVDDVVNCLLEAGVAPEDIGVIAPYADQIDLLQRHLQMDGLEVRTVDGFQGREKDVIVLSFVRSNDRGEMGFLADLRRLNVSITRARKKLILVGDRTTLNNEPTYRKLADYAEQRGELIRLGP